MFISDNIPRVSTVVAFLDKEYDFYYAGTGKRATYANYSEEESRSISLSDLTLWVKANFPEKEK